MASLLSEALRLLDLPIHWAIDAWYAVMARWGTSGLRAFLLESPLVGVVISGRTAESPPGTLFALICLVLSLGFCGKGYFKKAKIWLYASIYFCASRDKRANRATEWGIDTKLSPRKKIIFIRSGECEWNVVFRHNGLSFCWKLLCALAREAVLFVQADSVFIDSPLTMHGVEECQKLLRFLVETSPEMGCDPLCLQEHGDNEVCLVCGKFASVHKERHRCEGGGRASFPGQDFASKPVADLSVPEIVSVMRGDTARTSEEEGDGAVDPGKSVVVSSTLRRAISTVLICLTTRLLRQTPRKAQHYLDKVVLMDALQEVSRSMDTLALATAGSSPRAPLAETARKDTGDVVSMAYEKLLDPSQNKGNKSLSSCCMVRQNEFCKWVFEQREDWIIVSGHAVWFREFFRSYLHRKQVHDLKSKLIPPCGVVAFDFYRCEHNLKLSTYRVQLESIKHVYPPRCSI